MKRKEPTRLELSLYDALDNAISEFYADGISYLGEKKMFHALSEFNALYGNRKDGMWGNVVESDIEL